jgi:hypothetical protein
MIFGRPADAAGSSCFGAEIAPDNEAAINATIADIRGSP